MKERLYRVADLRTNGDREYLTYRAYVIIAGKPVPVHGNVMVGEKLLDLLVADIKRVYQQVVGSPFPDGSL